MVLFAELEKKINFFFWKIKLFWGKKYQKEFKPLRICLFQILQEPLKITKS